MSSARTTALHRTARGVAAGAALLLLAGCGGSDDKAAALDEAQVASVLPDQDAMPGWKRSEKAATSPMNDLMRSNLCANKGNKGCEESLFMGTVSFRNEKEKAGARFWMIAYKDEKAAEAAYDTLWKNTSRTTGPKKADLGQVGAERDARLGTQYGAGLSVTGQIRVGTAVLWLGSDALSEEAPDQELTEDLAALFSERAQQAQNGDKPSATL
ncbi:hypothetical protein OG230_17505 [Streptomyces sp. NBC_00234]|uniref:hypothetical protein n=1 Tax=Streptomyces sp. NBC_00234 TaxID=2903638 RepID=UPI002E2D30C0|nr:hypothetical protein [Streptomyces sp. NBC_00234]